VANACHECVGEGREGRRGVRVGVCVCGVRVLCVCVCVRSRAVARARGWCAWASRVESAKRAEAAVLSIRAREGAGGRDGASVACVCACVY
jgi:hypothetical protein